MTDTNYADGSANVLTNVPKLTDDLPMKLSIADSFNKNPAFSLFKGGLQVSKLLRFDCFSNPRVVELDSKPRLTDKVRLGFACKEGGYFAKLYYPF